jgi:YtkA-like
MSDRRQATGRHWLTLAAVLLLALAAACGPARSSSSAVPATRTPSLALESGQEALAPPGPTLGGQHCDSDLLVWLASEPPQPVQGTAEVAAYLVGTDGQPVADATVTFDTDMTNMSHGLYLVKAEPSGDGYYRGRVRFMMPGPWRIVVIVERPGRETVKSRFEFRVNPS